MIAFMLYHPRMETFNAAVNCIAGGIDPLITHTAVPGNQSAQTRNREATFPSLFLFGIQNRNPGIDQYRQRNRFGVGIAGIRRKTKNDDAQTHTYLRRRQTCTIQR